MDTRTPSLVTARSCSTKRPHGFLPASVRDQPKRPSSREVPVRAHVKPDANWCVVTYVMAFPEPPEGSGIGGSSMPSTLR